MLNFFFQFSSVTMTVVQPLGRDIQFISTPRVGSSNEKHLLRISYSRVQKESPNFLTLAEGIDQNVDIKISTLIFRAAPEPILALYDFVMATFVSSLDPSAKLRTDLASTGSDEPVEGVPGQTEGKIRVLVKFEGVQSMSHVAPSILGYELTYTIVVTLINEMINLATLSLSTADVTVLLRAKTLRVSGRLGNMTLTNDNENNKFLGDFNQLASIDGENFVDFRYQTYDPNEDHYIGVKSSVHFNAASIKFHFVEEPLHALYLFLCKLARLKGLYDAATQVAVQRASEIERMQFEVSIKSPIVVFPSSPSLSSDALVLRLGEIDARNISEPTVNRIIASLRGIQLVSCIHRRDEAFRLKIIDDIDISANAIQARDIDREQDVDRPDNQVKFLFPELRMKLNSYRWRSKFRMSNCI